MGHGVAAVSYEIIDPPFSLVFKELSRKELRGYFDWFLAVIPERIQILADAVRATPGYEHWSPEYSPASLEGLGEWFSNQIQTRLRTEVEMEMIRSRSKHASYFSADELTDTTISLAFDLAMYIAQVFLKNHPSLRWSQELGSKRNVFYGQPVLIGFSRRYYPLRFT